MISAGTSSRFVARCRKPSRSTPDEPPLYFPFESCGWFLMRTSRRVWLGRVVGRLSEPHDLVRQHVVRQHVGRAIRLGERPVFGDLVEAVVAPSADVARPGGHDVVEQFELRVAPVHHVPPVGLDGPVQDGSFVVLTAAVGSHVEARRHVTVHFEVRVQPPLHGAAFAAALPHGGLMMRGIAVISVASTRISVPGTSFSRSSHAAAPCGEEGSWPLNS